MQLNISLKNGCEMTVYLNHISEEIAWKDRPMVVICPGGGYVFRSEREAEPIAYRFLAAGIHAAIVHYSVAPARYPTAVLQLAEAVQEVRRHAGEWHVQSDQVFVMGFSAGGHLAATLGTLWNAPDIASALPNDVSHRPDGQILCYPVISSREFAHVGSFQSLIGDPDSPLWQKLSLEHQVSPDTVPAFLWHTQADQAVPVENSLFYAAALRKSGVPFELHIYENGAHGLSLCDRSTSANCNQNIPDNEGWINLAIRFVLRRANQ